MRKSNNNNNRIRKAQRKLTQEELRLAMSVPKSLPGNVSITRTYRYRCDTAGEYSIQDGDFLAMAGGICTVASSTIALVADTFKVHKIEIRAPNPSGTVTAKLQWNGTDYAGGKEISDTSISTAYPAFITSKPPPGSALSLQRGTGSNECIKLYLPAQAIIDVHVTHWMQDAGAALTATVITGSVGYYYWLYLDHHSLATAKIAPVDLYTIQ